MRRGAVESWSELDPHGFIEYLRDFDASRPALEWVSQRAAAALAAADPEQLFTIADRYVGAGRQFAQHAAIRAIGLRNPQAATSLAEAAQDGPDKASLLAVAGRAYARNYPDAAWAWAGTLTEDAERIMAVIAAENARSNFAHAVDLIVNDGRAGDAGLGGRFAAELFGVQMPPALFEQVAERLRETLAAPSGELAQEQALLGFLMGWGSVDERGAFEWALTHAASGGGGASLLAGLQPAARRDSSLAFEALERLPRALQSAIRREDRLHACSRASRYGA
jgi:hypothetical protein